MYLYNILYKTIRYFCMIFYSEQSFTNNKVNLLDLYLCIGFKGFGSKILSDIKKKKKMVKGQRSIYLRTY